MPVNGLMLTLNSGDHVADGVLKSIEGRPEVEVGELRERWLPLVVDACDERNARDVHAWLEGLPGVVQVDVILAGIDDKPNES